MIQLVNNYFASPLCAPLNHPLHKLEIPLLLSPILLIVVDETKVVVVNDILFVAIIATFMVILKPNVTTRLVIK